MLYSKDGGYPIPLPNSAERLDDGTFLMPLQPQDAAACGWIAVDDPPGFDPDTYRLTWDGSAWQLVAFTADELAVKLTAVKNSKLSELASVRYAHQIVIEYFGQTVAADDQTVNRIVASNQLAEKAGLPGATGLIWKISETQFLETTYDAIVQYGLAIGQHWQECFAKEKALSDDIQAATTITLVNDIDLTTGWPT